MAKSWTEKFNDPRPHQVKPVPTDIAGMKKGEIMLIPTPKIVDAFVARIPAGQAMDLKTFRGKLAKKYKAEVSCPITTSIHLRTVAENALEQHRKGAKLSEITPFWRVLDEDTPATAKLSCGVAFVTKQRKAEGL